MRAMRKRLAQGNTTGERIVEKFLDPSGGQRSEKISKVQWKAGDAMSEHAVAADAFMWSGNRQFVEGGERKLKMGVGISLIREEVLGKVCDAYHMYLIYII